MIPTLTSTFLVSLSLVISLVIKLRNKKLSSKLMGLELHPVLVVLTSSGTTARMSITLIT